MGLYSALFSGITTDASIAALLGSPASDAVYTGSAPAGTPLPYLVLQRTSERHEDDFSGSSGVARARVQIDVMAASPDTADALGEALRQLLHGRQVPIGVEAFAMKGTLDERRDSRSAPKDAGDVGIHRSSLDFLITHRETIPTY